MKIIVASIAFIALFLFFAAFIIKHHKSQPIQQTYPLFKQCNSQWGNNQLGTSNDTICSAGCLMSSSSMMINSYGVQLNGLTANPGTLNQWLDQNNGYVQGDLYVWASVDVLGFNFLGFLTNSQLISNFNNGHTIMLNVHNGGHWVLMTGYSGNTLYVNDPGFSVNSYQMNDVVRAGAYERTAIKDKILEHLKSLFL